MGHVVPRRRPARPGRGQRRSHASHRPVQAGAGRVGRGLLDGHHEPLLPSCVSRWRSHGERPPGAALRDPQGDGQHRRRRRTGCTDLRVLGWTGRHRHRQRQGRPRRSRPLQGGLRHPRRVRAVEGLRHPVRVRAEAERAARRHLPAYRRPRARLHQRARAPRDGRAQPRGRARADGEPQLPPWRRPDDVARQALPHRPQRPEGCEVRPGLPLRRRGPEGDALPGRSVGARRLHRAASFRLPGLPHRGHERRVGLRTRLHAELPHPEGEGRRVLRRPRGAAGDGRRRVSRAGDPDTRSGRVARRAAGLRHRLRS